MRVLRELFLSQAHWEKQPVGMCLQLHETPLLLDFLLCIEAARDRTSDSLGFAEEINEARRRIVRGVRARGNIGCSSCERKSDGQFCGEFTDPMLALSFVLARLAETYRKAARDANASPNRTALLRGYGNAIVPQVAAEFIKAALLSRLDL